MEDVTARGYEQIVPKNCYCSGQADEKFWELMINGKVCGLRRLQEPSRSKLLLLHLLYNNCGSGKKKGLRSPRMFIKLYDWGISGKVFDEMSE
ncbi:hypothetical protein Tco_1260780, partial [Tanacetum coccineum]